jgi:hypothetical protein
MMGRACGGLKWRAKELELVGNLPLFDDFTVVETQRNL